MLTLVHRARPRLVRFTSDHTFAPALAVLIGLGGCVPTYHGARASHFVSGPPLLDDAPSTQRVAQSAISSGALPPSAKATDDLGAIPVGLPQVIRACVLSDPRILAALESVEHARAEHTTASLLPNPSLLVSRTLVPLPGSPFNAETRQGGPPQLDIGLSYSLDTLIFGTRSAAMEATRLGVDVAFAEYADVARQRILEAIHAYYDVLEAREILRLTREEVEQLGRLHSLTERRVQLGGIGTVELDRIRVALSGGRRRLLRAKAKLDNARSRLRASLGRAMGAERADADGTLEIDSPPAPPDLRSAMQLAEEHRPDLLALQRQVVRLRADLTREQRTAWPSLSVSAGYTRQFQKRAIGFPDASSWGAGLEMSLPIFDRNQGNIARAQSAVRQAELLLSAAQIDLRAEVEQAIRDYNVAYQLVSTLDEQALAAASSARQRIEEAYGLGGRTLLEVLDAQAAFREVFREHVEARAELLRALHRVNAVVGTEVLR